ncbi:ankyrin [Akanthomyces lecanii RCEF 1005]|uniref:Ankyrin n=1 Tax=Akanthomyces lecanii RCEF 1005 TaxID=1081108 RepID=A0A162K1L1_CORDF|nr:ankyrin [Akanthomyces lecanii RCEF 1005]
MEPVGLAVGVVGLAGLFSVCLDAVQRFDAWKKFGDELATLGVRVEVQRLRLDKWGQAVGLKQNSASDIEGHHHPALDDARTSRTVKTLLTTIQEVFTRKVSALFTDETGCAGSGGDLAAQDHFGVSSTSRRARLGWAFRDKSTVRAAVEEFAGLIQDLHDLVPPLGDAEAQRGLRLWLLGRHTPNEVFEKALKGKLENTCQWIFCRQELLDWASSDFSKCSTKHLWIHGPPGFGKTALCATLLQHIKSTFTTPVVSFFFSSDDLESRRDPFVALRLWLVQLLPEPTVFSRLRRSWKNSQGHVATAGDVIGAFEEVIKSFSECTFVIDGIDECENGGVTNDNSSVTSFLKTVSRIADGTNTRILITSREDTAIRQGFMNNTGATFVEYKISQQDVRPDIDEYSRVVVRQKLIGRDGNTCEDLCQKMAERCEGQFLWIKLKGSRLSRYKAATLLKAEIEKTPSGLDDLYGRNWDRIGAIEDRDDRERAYAMMRWVSFATRPLTVAELTAALLVDLSCDNMQLDEIPYLLEDDYVENEILKMSASLLEIHEPLSETDGPDASAQTVHFTHFTAKQYFILRMAEKIDTLMMLLDRGANRSAISEAKSTALHVASYRGRLEVARKLLEDCSDINTRKQQTMSPLFQAAADGNVNVVKLLLERGGDPFVVNNKGLTLTQITAGYGYLDVFQVLLDTGLDVDTHKGLTPLHHACVDGHADMVRMLLARGANNNAMYEGLGALHAAAFYCHLHIFEILLSNGLDLDTAINTPFHITTGQGSVGMVRFLLECTAKVSETNRDSQLILFHASVTRGQSSVTRLLIEENDAFGVNARTDDGLTPAHLAARAGHVDLIQMLIDQWADVSMTKISGKTPLHDAARFGHVEILHADVVQLLLGSGTALTAKTANGLTPLHAAALQGHTEVVKLCLDSGAFIDTADVEGDTPLIDASIWGRIDTIKLLLDRGANLEATNLEGQTSLKAASCQGQTAVAKLLLEIGAKKDVTSYFGSTPLMAASYLGHTAIVKLLLENGANVEARDVDGRTPSIAASYASHDEVLEPLLSKECCTETTDPEVRDRFGQTALSFAVGLQKHAVARRLLPTGKVSLLSRDQFGRTPVSWAKGLGYANMDNFFADEDEAKAEQAPELPEDEGLVTQDRGTDTEEDRV